MYTDDPTESHLNCQYSASWQISTDFLVIICQFISLKFLSRRALWSDPHCCYIFLSQESYHATVHATRGLARVPITKNAPVSGVWLASVHALRHLTSIIVEASSQRASKKRQHCLCCACQEHANSKSVEFYSSYLTKVCRNKVVYWTSLKSHLSVWSNVFRLGCFLSQLWLTPA